MNEKIQISDLVIDNYTPKEAMQRVVEYLNTEGINVIEIITLGTLGELVDNEELQRQVNEFDITFAGDMTILEAAGIEDAKPMLFIKMVLRFLHKYRVRVFLLAEDAANLEKMKARFAADYGQTVIVGGAILEEQGVSDDLILNMVNGAEADCILSTLPSPKQEQFIIKNKLLLDVKLWLGLGNSFHGIKERQSFISRIKKRFVKQILKKEMEKKGENA